MACTRCLVAGNHFCLFWQVPWLCCEEASKAVLVSGIVLPLQLCYSLADDILTCDHATVVCIFALTVVKHMHACRRRTWK